jgi:hypothetical protein
LIAAVPGPAGCGGVGEETGGLPVPSPPQADESSATASANNGARSLKHRNFGLKALLIRDIGDDMQDIFFVISGLLAVNAFRMLA